MPPNVAPVSPPPAIDPDLPGDDERLQSRLVSALLIEDSPLDAMLVQNALASASERGLRHRYLCRWAKTLAEAREFLSREKFDVAIVDLQLPDSRGLATLAAVRKAAPRTALVVVTGQGDHESAKEALRLGAEDYLVKGEFTFPSLERSVLYALDRRAFMEERRRDQTERDQLQEQLRRAQRMEALGRLAGGVAHDFNNILTIILGHAGLLQSGIVSGEDETESLTEIQQAGERAARLTAQLLAFSRQQAASPRVLNMNVTIGDLHNMLSRLIGEHIELVTELSPSLPNVRIDPGHVEQVLMNLAVNARDAMPAGGILTIRTKAIQADDELRRLRPYVNTGRYVQLSVSDTGIGMNDAVRARIFEPFFTTKEKGRGTGLGLSTVYGIVKQADGYIWCTSVEGLGTKFEIFLPMTEAALDADVIDDFDEPVSTAERILVVEDDPPVRAIIMRTLRGAGYVALEAANGDEAQEIARSSVDTIHLLLTDMILPGMTGREIAQRVTASCPSIHMVYMSGYTDDDVFRRGDLPRNHLFLQKPFKGTELLSIVRTALGHKPASAKPAEG